MDFTEQASQAIRAAGGRFTPQRRLIVELLADSTGHLDADGLHWLAHQRDQSISLATVYRTLNTLEQAGLVAQRYFSPGHEKKYYEPLTAHEHYHFTCRACGQVVEFDAPLVETIRQEVAARLGILVDHACMCLEGLCQSCAAGHADSRDVQSRRPQSVNAAAQ